MASDDYEDEKWVPEDALASLTLEQSLRPDETSTERAKRLLIENVDVAAAGMIWSARNSQNERIRHDAQKYVMERVLGRAGDAPAMGTIDELFEKLDKMNEMAASQQQAAIQANGSGTDPWEE
jgi:hypothetical protein